MKMPGKKRVTLTVKIERHNSRKPKIVVESSAMDEKKAMLEIWGDENPVVNFNTENGKFLLILEASDARK